MRGNVMAALAAAASIALFAYWRTSENSGDDLVDAASIPGTWKQAASETCNPPLPANLTIGDDGRFEAGTRAGVWAKGADGRFVLQFETSEFPDRVFRAEPDRLELLNQLGCKATYVRAGPQAPDRP